MTSVSNCPRCQQPVTIPRSVDAMAQVRCPLCSAEFPLREALDHAVLTPPELVAVGVAPPGREDDDAMDIPVGEVVGQRPRVTVAPAAGAPSRAGSTRGAGSVSDVPLGWTPPSARKKRGPGFVRQLTGIVLGGFLGLAIGYYVLNWIGGQNADFLEIPLPGIPHTQAHWAKYPKVKALVDRVTGEEVPAAEPVQVVPPAAEPAKEVK
ncbi:MAG: hypothetical protein ACYC35_25905 [Pirellulales bacterium]